MDLTEEEFQRIRQTVYRLSGISLAESKKQLVKSRLQRRIRELNLTSYGEYERLISGCKPDSDEVLQFINSITTNKSDFFRENHHFEFVVRQLIPELKASGQNRLKVWHAGCSTGDEVYSLGMAISEAAPGFQFVQLASDIDTNVLDFAQAAIYEEDKIRHVPEKLLKKWFLKGKGSRLGSYCAVQELRDHVTFRRVNLLDDPWPMKKETQFDLIFCRNVLIYFDRQTQRRLFDRFHEKLNPGGYLILGHSESMQGDVATYDYLGKTIYRALPSRGVRQAA